MGYDQYFAHLDEQAQVESDIGLLHYARTLIERLHRLHPHSRLGVSLLGRSYLFPALDALLPHDVALQSMESSICWNRSSRVPMEYFATVPDRDRLLVPRLDDDENELAMQFNAGTYARDRINTSPSLFGLTGVAPQSGRTRGLEHNFRYLAQGAWNADCSPEGFYRDYVRRIFGVAAADDLAAAYGLLEENEHALGFGVDTREHGHCFQGIGNFINYADSRDICWLKQFRIQVQPLDGPDFPDWNVREESSPRISHLRFRLEQFEISRRRLKVVLGLFAGARGRVLPGAKDELEYLIYKTDSFLLHLKTLCCLMRGLLAYDAAFRAKYDDCEARMMQHFTAAESIFAEAADRAAATAEKIAEMADHPDDRYILFRYNIRFVLPIREFGIFVRNIVNYYRGLPYWQPVNWDVIDP